METIPRRHGRRVLAALLSLFALVASALAISPPVRAADQSIAVDFSAGGGAPTHRASGWIYGMTEDASGPPDHFFTDVKYRYMRAGGAQLDSPGGWVSGKYDRRWNATRAQILRTRSLGGEFVLLVHDLWGADGYPISRFPGDNGDWTDYDNFLTRVINDVRAAGAPVEWDIWNEPNISLFWNRPQSQYFELWRRAYQRIRAAFPTQLIVGPSCACVPSTGNNWWNQYLDFVKANNAVPDIVSWHSLPGDPVANVAAANATLDPKGIPHPRPYQINEYGASNEQNPGGGAWYIARLERAGADGLRANWASGNNLHNDLASLLVRNGGQYQPKGEWWAYRFYGSQTGQIASVTPSQAYDAFATKDTGNAKVLVGGRGTTGNIAVDLRHLDATSGVVENNQVRVVTERIPSNGGAAVQGPVTVQNTVVTLSGNATTVNLAHTNADDAFSITVLPPSSDGPPPGGSATALRNVNANRCLDVPNASQTNGTQVALWDCNGGANQQWTPTAAKQLQVYGGKCLAAENAGTSAGTRAVIGDCGSQSSGQWNLNTDGTVTNVASGLCLDANGAGTANGTQVILWTCHGGNNQKWTQG